MALDPRYRIQQALQDGQSVLDSASPAPSSQADPGIASQGPPGLPSLLKNAPILSQLLSSPQQSPQNEIVRTDPVQVGSVTVPGMKQSNPNQPVYPTVRPVGTTVQPTAKTSSAVPHSSGLSQWATSLIPSLTKQLSAYGVAPSAVPAFAAQLDIETGGGKSSLVKRANNVAGIGGRNNYKSYATVDDGLADYVALLARKYPNVIKAGSTGDPKAVAVALGNSPWAAQHYRLGSSGNEDGTTGKIGTEGQAIIAHLGSK